MNLIAAAIIGIVVIVLLIAVCKVHPFLSLLAGSFTMAVCAGVEYDKAFDSFTSGVGGTISNVGLLIAFGSIIGTTLFRSGGADAIVDTIMTKTPLHRLPWAMALIAFIVGIPMFFEVGVVILIPVVLFVARRSKSPVVLLGIPALAGLSTLHAFVPPPPRSADRHRRRLRVLLPPQRRRLLAGQGILRYERGSDAKDLVADGDHPVGGRPGLRDAALAGALTH
ncbi:GntP family permease [Bifidobacterium bifidum]